MYMTYYPYELMQTLTAILAKNDLLDFDKQTHQFHTTLKGQRYLELYEGMQRQCADFSLNEIEMYNNKDYWKNELKSLGIEPKRSNELNDPEELKDLVDRLKQSMYQDYKTAYSNQ